MPLLGIALGGGGVRGAAHVGVLQEIDSAGIKIDSIAGVSASANPCNTIYLNSRTVYLLQDSYMSRSSYASTAKGNAQ